MTTLHLVALVMTGFLLACPSGSVPEASHSAGLTVDSNCCHVNQSLLWKKDLPEIGTASESLRPLLDYDFLVPELQLHASLSYYGTAIRLRSFVSTLLSGSRPLKVGVVGGSVSYGKFASDVGHNDWFSLVVAWLSSVAKQPLSFRNGCVPGTPSAYMVLCLQYSVDADTDLVFVEYTVNDGVEDKIMANQIVMAMERLYRRILELPNKPAVVSVQMPLVRPDGFCLYYRTSEHVESSLSYFYDVTTVSPHTAVYQLAVQHRVPGFEYERLYARNHPANSGHKVIADLLVHMFQHTALDLLVRPVSPAEKERFDRPLPIPMYGAGNVPPKSTACAVGDDFKSLITTSSPGWAWTNEGTDKAPKWGMVAKAPGEKLVVRVSSQREGSPPGALVPVIFYFLMSYTDMGTARFDCVSGCVCSAIEVDAFTASHVSQTYMEKLMVSQAAQCDIQITVQDRTTSGGHKFKLTGIVVSEAGDKASLLKPQQLIFPDIRKSGKPAL